MGANLTDDLKDAGLVPIRPYVGSTQQSVLVLCVVRNEQKRLPHFLRHYRQIGVTEFVFVDNGSTDRTREMLLSSPSIAIYEAQGRYSQSNYGVTWTNALLNVIAHGRWVLVVDADELLIYPRYETTPIASLCGFLTSVGASGLKTFLLDMYSDQPLSSDSPDLDSHGNLLDRYCLYDVDSYHQRDTQGVPIRGGPRHRLFWNGRDEGDKSPVLIKYPLVRWEQGNEFLASTHHLKSVRTSGLTGALLHFKLTEGFRERTEIEVARAEHWDSSRQYQTYLRGLQASPHLTAVYSGTRTFSGSQALVDSGLMREPPAYVVWLTDSCAHSEQSQS